MRAEILTVMDELYWPLSLQVLYFQRTNNLPRLPTGVGLFGIQVALHMGARDFGS